MADPLDRRETDIALERHRQDRFAHAAMAERLMVETASQRLEREREVDAAIRRLEERGQDRDLRLTKVERFQERVIGGLIVASAILGGGLVTLFLHLFGVKG